MKLRLVIPLAAALAVATFAGGASAATIDQRQHRQEMRIRAAWQRGEITRAEFQRLRIGQRRIRRMERLARRDGFVSAGERARIWAALDRESRMIARLAHNRRDRNVSW